MKIGEFNKLTVTRLVDFGAYLADSDDAEAAAEVLLPSKYIDRPLAEGDEVEAFVYRDSEDRPVAVTTRPLAQVGEVAVLRCTAVTRVGAFLDWGLPKELLVPFSEQRVKMREGGNYAVYVYLDHATGRVAATAKIEKYLDNVPPTIHAGTRTEAMVWKRTDIGWQCVVENKHTGIIYHNQLFAPVSPGDRLKVIVRKVRSDGKLDLMPGGSSRDRSEELADRIRERIAADGTLTLNDKSTPEEIRAVFQCSKRDFKRALGHVMKEGLG